MDPTLYNIFSIFLKALLWTIILTTNILITDKLVVRI